MRTALLGRHLHRPDRAETDRTHTCPQGPHRTTKETGVQRAAAHPKQVPVPDTAPATWRHTFFSTPCFKTHRGSHRKENPQVTGTKKEQPSWIRGGAGGTLRPGPEKGLRWREGARHSVHLHRTEAAPEQGSGRVLVPSPARRGPGCRSRSAAGASCESPRGASNSGPSESPGNRPGASCPRAGHEDGS